LGKTNDRGASCCQESSERVAGKATWGTSNDAAHVTQQQHHAQQHIN